MTVGELIDILKDYDPDAIIYYDVGDCKPTDVLDFLVEDVEYQDDPHWPKVYFNVGDELTE